MCTCVGAASCVNVRNATCQPSHVADTEIKCGGRWGAFFHAQSPRRSLAKSFHDREGAPRARGFRAIVPAREGRKCMSSHHGGPRRR